jgi:hypothetical protein
MSTKILTKNFNVENAKNFVTSVTEGVDSYYIFAAKHQPYENQDILDSSSTVEDTIQVTTFDVYNDLIFGKKVSTTTDVNYMVPRNEWVSGTVYAIYDHEDADLHNKQFFTITNVGVFYHFYKCLNNNNGGESTVEPTGTSLYPFQTSDNYVWKYMSTVPLGIFNRFKTVNYAPIAVLDEVITSATAGTIENIQIVSSGSGYNNYIPSAEFTSGDIKLEGSSVFYGLSDAASSLNDYYNNCTIKITSGVAEGEYRTIVDYTVDAGIKKIEIASAFSNAPSSTDTYEIYPTVFLYSDGTHTVNAAAIAIIDADASNSISYVDILDSGENYREATAVLNISSVVSVTEEASLRTIISPPGGHGSDPISELGANRVCITSRFIKSEAGFIPVTNDFRTVGLIKNPTFNEIKLELDLGETSGTFLVGEPVYSYKDIILTGSVALTQSSTVVTGNTTQFVKSLSNNDSIYITDGTNKLFTTVNAISNSIQLTIKSAATYTSSSAFISLLDKSYYGEVTEVGSSYIKIKDVSPGLVTGDTYIYGNTSLTTSKIDMTDDLPISIADGEAINGNYETFVGLTRFSGYVSSDSGDITEDGELTQNIGNEYTTPTAIFHSYANNDSRDTIYASNIKNVFEINNDIIAESGTVTFALSNKYNGDLLLDSGKVLYLENLDPISRANNKSEIIKIVLEF